MGVAISKAAKKSVLSLKGKVSTTVVDLSTVVEFLDLIIVNSYEYSDIYKFDNFEIICTGQCFDVIYSGELIRKKFDLSRSLKQGEIFSIIKVFKDLPRSQKLTTLKRFSLKIPVFDMSNLDTLIKALIEGEDTVGGNDIFRILLGFDFSHFKEMIYRAKKLKKKKYGEFRDRLSDYTFAMNNFRISELFKGAPRHYIYHGSCYEQDHGEYGTFHLNFIDPLEGNIRRSLSLLALETDRVREALEERIISRILYFSDEEVLNRLRESSLDMSDLYLIYINMGSMEGFIDLVKSDLLNEELSQSTDVSSICDTFKYLKIA